MNIQDSANKEDLKQFTSALMQAMGMNSQQSQEKLTPSSVFLTKLFAKNVQGGTRKLNEIRFNRLNGYLYHMFYNMPSEQTAVDVMCQIIIAFLNNENIYKFETSSVTSVTCYWIGNILKKFAEHKFTTQIRPLLQKIINNVKINCITVEEFQELARKSQYISNIKIRKEDDIKAQKNIDNFTNFLFQMEINDQILEKLEPTIIFRNLFQTEDNKKQIMNLYLNYVRKVQNFDFESFKKIFIEDRVFDKSMIQAILYALDTEIFDLKTFDEISRELFTKTLKQNNDKVIFSGCLKGLKSESRFIQILGQTSRNSINELAEAFINDTKINNLYLLYLINKSSGKLSDKFIFEPFTVSNTGEDMITNRKAIIAALAIIDHEPYYQQIMEFFLKFYPNEENKKRNLLKLLIFSFYRIPKSYLFTKIIKSINLSDLDIQSQFTFLPNDGITNISSSSKSKSVFQIYPLNQKVKQKLQSITHMQMGNSSQVFKLKLQLHWLAGSNIKYMSDLQVLKKFSDQLNQPTSHHQQIVEKLKTLPQELLSVVLMAINNKMTLEYMLNLMKNVDLIQWLFNTQKKEVRSFVQLITYIVQKTNYQVVGLQAFIFQIFEFNAQKFYLNLLKQGNKNKKFEIEDLSLDDQFDSLTNVQSIQRLENLNFSEYLLNHETNKNKGLQYIEKPKLLIIETRQLLRNSPKPVWKKQARTLFCDVNIHIRSCRILKFLSENNSKFFDANKIKKIVQSLLKTFSPEFQFFQNIKCKASQSGLQCPCIYDVIPFILSVNYDEGTEFLSKMLGSKIPSPANQDKDKKKKMKRKSDTNLPINQQQKLIAILIEKIESIFGDPNQLKTYTKVLDIINFVAKRCSRDELAVQIVRWISQMKIFHCSTHDEWAKKVENYINMWEYISVLIMENISHQQLERHFLMMTDLLNTLYEKYRKQQKFLQLQREILKGLYIVYRLDCQKNSQKMMQQQNVDKIPYEKINQCLAFHHPKQLNQPHIYYCYDCDKTICQICANFIHKIHDKVYRSIGTQTQCPHSVKKQNRSLKKNRDKQAIMNQIQQLRERERQREQLKFIFMSKLGSNGQIPPQIYNHRRDRFQLERLSRESRDILLGNEQNQWQEQQDKNQQNKQVDDIESCPQKQYIIRQIAGAQFQQIYPIFNDQNDLKIQRKSTINLSPLFNLLMRQLKNSSFITGQSLDIGPKRNVIQEAALKTIISTERYLLFKSDLFRFNGMAISSRSPYSNNIQSLPSGAANTIAINDKFMVVVAGPANLVLSVEFQTIKNKFNKRQQQKRYREAQPIEPLVYSKSKAIQPIIQLSFCPNNKQMIAVVEHTKIAFEHITSDNRVQKIATPDFSYAGQINKFEWVKGLKDRYYFAFLTRQLHLGKIVRTNQPQRKSRIFLKSRVKDFGTYVSSSNNKNIILTVIDSVGKVYRGNVQAHSNSTIDFSDKLVNLQYKSDDPIIKICCYTYFVIASTLRGNIVFMNFDQDHNLIGSVTHINIIQNIKKTHAAQQYPKINSFNKINQIRVLTRNESQIFICCMLSKQHSPNETKRVGNLAIITYNFRKKISYIQIMNDNAQTLSYDFTLLAEKDFLIISNHQQGQVWTMKFSTSKIANNQGQIKIPLSVSKIQEYSKACQNLNILKEIKFYDKTRLLSNKAHPDLSSFYKMNFDDITLKYQPKQKYNHFVTMIAFEISSTSKENPMTIVINFLNKNYQYALNQNNNFKRQVQFPLTIKQSLEVYMGVQELCITFLQIEAGNATTKKFTLNSNSIHGVRWDEKSPLLQSLASVARLIAIYQQYPKDSVEYYFYNENRCIIGQHKYKQIEKTLNQKKYSISETNLFMKLELFRQSLSVQNLNEDNVCQILQRTRKQLLTSSNKQQLTHSIKKLLRKLNCQVFIKKPQQIWSLGHPKNYKTLIDIYETFELYKDFKIDQTIITYRKLLKKLLLMLNSHTINCFIVMKICPQITNQIAKFYHKIITDFKNDFKMTENGLDSEDKQKLVDMCEKVVRILAEEYQLSINTGYYQNNNNKMQECINSPQRNLLNVLQSIFCIHKKDVYREVDINPFVFMRSVFALGQKKYENVVINFLDLQKIQISTSLPQISDANRKDVPQNNPSGNQNREKMSLQKIQKMAEQIMYDEFSNQSQEQEKQIEQQNRQMQEEYYLNIVKDQNQVNQGLDGILDQQFEQQQQNPDQQGIDANKFFSLVKEGQDLMNLDRIYQYLNSKVHKQKQTIIFKYQGLCQNLLIHVFQRSDNFLTLDNSVFYVGLVYHLLILVQAKLRYIFGDSAVQADFDDEYTNSYVRRIIKAVDEALTNDRVSILFMAINNFMEVSYEKNKDKKMPTRNKTLLSNLFIKYYNLNNQSRGIQLLNCSNNQFWHPKNNYCLTPLSSVIKFQYFETQNRFYQILFLGNIYQNMVITQNTKNLNQQSIKQITLRTVVQYNLRIYKNIMYLMKWQNQLSRVKMQVGFQNIYKGKQQQGLKTIYGVVVPNKKQNEQKLDKSQILSQQMKNKREERINMLESLLGKGKGMDDEILKILNEYYKEE